MNSGENHSNKLENKIITASDGLEELLEEINEIIDNGYESFDDSLPDIEELEINFVEVENNFQDYKNQWTSIEAMASQENKFAHELFRIVLDKFGKKAETGYCWQFDEDNIQTIWRQEEVTDDNFDFEPFKLETIDPR